MNLDQIALRISNPNSCIPTETPVLQELAEKYPYAQVFSILYLKSLSLQNDIGFDEALQKHAYRITDRMKLYDLIHTQNERIEEITSETLTAETVIALETSDLALNSIPETNASEGLEKENLVNAEEDELLQEISSEILFEKGLIDEKIEPESEPILNPGVEIIEKDEACEESEPELKDFTEIDADPILNEISQEIVEELHLSAHELTEISLPETFKIEDSKVKETQNENDIPDLDLEIISEIVENIYSDKLEQTIQESPNVEKKSEINQVVEVEPKQAIENAKMSFTSWLKSGINTSNNLPTSEIKKEEETQQSPDKQKVDIIDAFIKTEPRISKVKKEFYSPSKKAKESISTEGLIYSETLAEIFAMQGNFPKSITAYQQLMLTNPEKKIFFAKRIEELKEKLNT